MSNDAYLETLASMSLNDLPEHLLTGALPPYCTGWYAVGYEAYWKARDALGEGEAASAYRWHFISCLAFRREIDTLDEVDEKSWAIRDACEYSVVLFHAGLCNPKALLRSLDWLLSDETMNITSDIEAVDNCDEFLSPLKEIFNLLDNPNAPEVSKVRRLLLSHRNNQSPPIRKDAPAHLYPRHNGSRVTRTPHKIFAITGVGGFIGQRLAFFAQKEGYQVRGLELDPAAAERARSEGVEVIEGDICDPKATRALCKDADVVCHTAAIVDEDGDRRRFHQVNVDGTRQVIRAADEAGTRRVIHLSSVMVYGFDYPDNVDEAGPLRGEDNPYCETKILGELAAREALARSNTELVILRPGDVYGARSRPWVVRPLDFIRRRLMTLPDGGRGLINHVHVDNLVDAILLTVHHEAAANTLPFNITDGARTTTAEFFGRLARMVNAPSPRTLPAPVLRWLFSALEGGARLIKQPPLARPATVPFLCRSGRYSDRRARETLGFSPRVSLDEGMARIGRVFFSGNANSPGGCASTTS